MRLAIVILLFYRELDPKGTLQNRWLEVWKEMGTHLAAIQLGERLQNRHSRAAWRFRRERQTPWRNLCFSWLKPLQLAR